MEKLENKILFSKKITKIGKWEYLFQNNILKYGK